MVSCKVCISRVHKSTYSVTLKYADEQNPVHAPLFFAQESVKTAAAYLFRKSLIGYDDDLMRMYNYRDNYFIDYIDSSENSCIAYTGAKSLNKSQVLDCINKLLVAIHNKDVDGELLVEINGNIIERWRSKPLDKFPQPNETLSKEEKILRCIILS